MRLCGNKWRNARRSYLEQASSSVPKVKEQTDVESSNSPKASLATGAKNPLSMAGKMKKIVVWLSASSRVSWLQVWKQMRLWHAFPISTCWWWEVTSARGREKKVLKEQLLFWGKKESKVVYLKTQIQWILFYGKLEKWNWTLRPDTPWNSWDAPATKPKFGKEKSNLEVLSQKVNVMSESLRARFWGMNTWGNLTTSRLWQQSSVEFGEKNAQCWERET